MRKSFTKQSVSGEFQTDITTAPAVMLLHEKSHAHYRNRLGAVHPLLLPLTYSFHFLLRKRRKQGSMVTWEEIVVISDWVGPRLEVGILSVLLQYPIIPALRQRWCLAGKAWLL